MYCWYNVEIYPYCNASLPLKCSQKIYLENYFCLPGDSIRISCFRAKFSQNLLWSKREKYIQLIKYCSLTYMSCLRTSFIHSSILIRRQKSFILWFDGIYHKDLRFYLISFTNYLFEFKNKHFFKVY